MGKEMFSYQLPDGGLNTSSFMNDLGHIKFDPPVYEQRYTSAVRILEDPCWKADIKKVVDFGCAEMRLLPLIRRVRNVEHILEVDIDETLLKMNQQRAVPLVSDYLQKRDRPLRVEILKGSIDASVENLRNVDAVVAIEIIEHLYQDTLDQVPQNIFGFMQPKLAIFSTPNSEFNVLFEPLLANGFRHLDHKFEWTRAQFKKWALDICQRYPNYSVSIMGVGMPPPDRKEIGHVSQIAIFARNDVIGRPLIAPVVTDAPADPNPELQYEEIYAVDFPFVLDDRTKEDKLWEEAQFHMDRCRRFDDYFNQERGIYQLPLSVLRVFTASVGGTDDELCAILKAKEIEVEGDFIILPEIDENDLSYRHYDDCYDDEYGSVEEELVGAAVEVDAEYDNELAAGLHKHDDSEEENWDDQ